MQNCLLGVAFEESWRQGKLYAFAKQLMGKATLTCLYINFCCGNAFYNINRLPKKGL